MKTELRLSEHTAIQGAHVVEVWYHGKFLATITGADGPGIRIVSKYEVGEPIRSELVTELRIKVS